MKSIGFKNFRKFIEFPEMKFNDITLMVGANNSGKSTLVKAVLLVMDYLKNQQNQSFSFSTDNVNNVNIMSFDRARCKFQLDDLIYFSATIDNYDIKIKVSGDKDAINGIVEEVFIKDTHNNIEIQINFSTQFIEVTKSKNYVSRAIENAMLIQQRLDFIEREFDKLQKDSNAIGSPEFMKRIAEINQESESLKKKQANMTKEQLDNMYSLRYDINLHKNASNSNFIEYVRDFLNENEIEKKVLINLREDKGLSDEQNEKLEVINILLSSSSELVDSIENFVKAINSHFYYYWSAETQKQSALFSIRDDNNALAKAIHDFSKLRIQRGDDEWLFVENQMRGFEIGERLEIISHVGEAYECNIFEAGSSKSISLADKGMGSIQLMTLFFRLATIINRCKNHKENITLIIEEPELNLHPKLQSKLAALFEIMNKYYGVKFIIETHSEYLVRQSQVIVNEAKYKDIDDLLNNPFATFYFKSEGTPYPMEYRTDGKFSNEFGTGFFDVAANLAFEIF